MPFEYVKSVVTLHFHWKCAFRKTVGDQFNFTLPSDASVNYYPDNTASRFVAKLSERVCLEGNYEVGLSKIIYRTCGTTLTAERKNIGLVYSVLEYVLPRHTSKPVTTGMEPYSHPV
jgi:hypothetical protein